jgi:undecaprenyl diphosphate synthase
MRKPTPHPSGAKPPKLSKTLIPNHVAVVMDGNGRWAKQRGLPRTAGHQAGEAALFDLVEVLNLFPVALKAFLYAINVSCNEFPTPTIV